MIVTIAVDAMGGDHGAKVTVPASLSFLKKHNNVEIILVGHEQVINTYLAKYDAINHSKIRIWNATEVVEMDESPQSALKNKKDSSMRVAINLVKDGIASACVSAGNTGALMATARFVLKTLPGIDRPAIAASLPNEKGTTYMLDLGANADCTPEQLLQFAVMGAMLVNCVEHVDAPSVGLLNIGSEDMKGNDIVKKASELLRSSHLNFYGNVEGDDIYRGTTDVVVCDGFVGNVALKASEGLAHMISAFLTKEFKRNFFTKLSALLAMPVIKAFKKDLDPRHYNGASFLGLRGVVVKSHGGTDAYGFEFAINKALEESKNNIVSKISAQLELEQEKKLSNNLNSTNEL